MKKILALSAILAATASGVFAQGTITFNNTTATYVTTNNGTVGNIASGNSGNIIDFTVLVAPMTSFGVPTSITNPTNSVWLSTGLSFTNSGTAAGRVLGYSSVTVPSNWAAGSTNSYIIVAWSANLGSSWATVSQEAITGNWTTAGLFGYSAVGFNQAGGSVNGNSVPSPNLCGTSATTQGTPVGGFALSAVAPSVTPEPSTIALAGMGIASLLAFRRRNSSK